MWKGHASLCSMAFEYTSCSRAASDWSDINSRHAKDGIRGGGGVGEIWHIVSRAPSR